MSYLGEQTKKEHKPFHNAVISYIADFKKPMSADEKPDDYDWHRCITVNGQLKLKTDSGMVTLGKLVEVVAHYTHDGFWTLGSQVPPKPIPVIAWDNTIQMENTTGKPVLSNDGLANLGEAICESWRKDFDKAVADYKKKSTFGCRIAAKAGQFAVPVLVV